VSSPLVNHILGSTAIGSNPPDGALVSTLANVTRDSPNCWPLEALATVAVKSVAPLTFWVPIPKGSRIVDVFADPITVSTAAITVTVGNETGGDTDFGTLSIGSGSANRVQVSGITFAKMYTGVTGNSVKVVTTPGADTAYVGWLNVRFLMR
jgi:hypothetical protein